MLTRKKLDMTTQKTARPLSQRQRARVIFNNCLTVCGASTHISPKSISAFCKHYENVTYVISAMHLSLDGAPVRLQDKPSLRIEDELSVRHSLSLLITEDLGEDTPVNVDLASEDLLIYRVLASA